MSTITQPRRSVQPRSRKPVVAELTLHINGTPYVVIAIAPGPDNTRAYRLVKEGNADSVYDVCRTVHGIVSCSCPSYEATYRGNGLATCKHGQALIHVGLLESPFTVAAPAPIADEPAEVNCANHAVEAPTPAVSPLYDNITQRSEPPARVAPFDADLYRAQDAVAGRRALWLSHRHLHTSEPMPSRMTLCSTEGGPAELRDVVFIDDDGTLLPTLAEIDAGHKAAHLARVRELMEGNRFLPAAREVEPVPCCDPAESMPCQACVNADEPAGKAWDPTVGVDEDEDPRHGPQDDGGGGWDAYDDDRWAVNGTIARSLAERVDDHARGLRALGSPLGDLLAERAEQLAAEVRFLDASTVAQYRDRREACLDVARDAAEARAAARCC